MGGSRGRGARCVKECKAGSRIPPRAGKMNNKNMTGPETQEHQPQQHAKPDLEEKGKQEERLNVRGYRELL